MSMIFLLEWLKLKRQKIQNIGENVEQLELSHTLLLEIQNDTGTLQQGLAVSFKVKH